MQRYLSTSRGLTGLLWRRCPRGRTGGAWQTSPDAGLCVDPPKQRVALSVLVLDPRPTDRPSQRPLSQLATPGARVQSTLTPRDTAVSPAGWAIRPRDSHLAYANAPV